MAEVRDTASLARIAALDIGQRRIGIAISDELGLTAQPLMTYQRSPRRDNGKHDAKSILRLLRKAGCRAIIVGNPLYLSGELSPQARRVQQFAAILSDHTDLPVQLWDERLSTAEAHSLLDQAGHGLRHRDDLIDQVAATLILKSYMDARQPALLLPDPEINLP